MNKAITPLLLFGALLLLSRCDSNVRSKQDAAPPTQDRYVSSSTAAIEHAQRAERVTFTTSDGVLIVGTFHRAGEGPAPAVLCLHQWMSDRSSYDEMAKLLVSAGIHVLAIDQRGFGESTVNSTGGTVESTRRIEPDIAAAMAFLHGLREVDGKRLGIIGASYGASNALRFAAVHADIRALCLLSPGVNYFNVLPTEEAIGQYGDRPLFSAAARDDRRSAEAVELYARMKKSSHTVRLLDGSEHGTRLTAGSAELRELIVSFFRDAL